MTTTGYCGLPVCLSGVHILPQALPPYRGVRSLSEDINERSHRLGAQSSSDTPNLASDFHASSSIGITLTQPTITDARYDDRLLQQNITVSSRVARLPVAEEMADVDRRREVMKKQRCLQNAGNLSEEYSRIPEQNEVIIASFGNHEARLHGQSDCMYKNICAKAA